MQLDLEETVPTCLSQAKTTQRTIYAEDTEEQGIKSKLMANKEIFSYVAAKRAEVTASMRQHFKSKLRRTWNWGRKIWLIVGKKQIGRTSPVTHKEEDRPEGFWQRSASAFSFRSTT